MTLDRTVTARLTEQQIDDIAELGGGNFSAGLRLMHAEYFGKSLKPVVDGRAMSARRAPPPKVERTVLPPPAAPALKPQRYIPPPRGYIGKR